MLDLHTGLSSDLNECSVYSNAELKDRLGEPLGAPAIGAPVSQGWRDQLHAALIGLGYATREAEEAVTAVAPQAEAAGGPPQVGRLLKAALQTLNRAR